MTKYNNSGWHRQHVRHVKAAKYGNAGGISALDMASEKKYDKPYSQLGIKKKEEILIYEELRQRRMKQARNPNLIRKKDNRDKLMREYAKMCGYNYVPFTWSKDDYTEKGWKKLIEEAS